MKLVLLLKYRNPQTDNVLLYRHNFCYRGLYEIFKFYVEAGVLYFVLSIPFLIIL